MLISKTIRTGRANPRNQTGENGYWIRVKVLGIPVYTKFVCERLA